jgi:hypothetical protein
MTAKNLVIPAKAGIQFLARCQRESLKSLLKLAYKHLSKKNFNFFWIPVCTGMTAKNLVIPAEAGIQFLTICQIEILITFLKLA